MRLQPLIRKTGTPLFRQIVDQVIGLVQQGALKPGFRLPASRHLAEELDVNRSTVVRAYQELWSLGYLETRPGGYSTIRARGEMAALPSARKSSRIDWSRFHSPLASPETDPHPACEPETLDFSRLVPDERLFPAESFRLALNRVMRRKGGRLLGYGDPLGYPDLRRYVADRMRLHGVSIAPEQVLLTTGSQNALELVLKLMTRPGTPVVVESPTYSAVIPLLRTHGLDVRGVRMRGDGPDLKQLERIFRSSQPPLFYTIPNFHNPTGITTGQQHRERLLAMCGEHRVVLVEDGFEEEMKYFGRAVLPIKSMDREGVVVYVGSFSKVLFPGIRVGWVAADRDCISRLADIRRATQLTGSPLIQAGLSEYCESGEYDRHIGRLHREFRKRMQTALRMLREMLGNGPVQWTEPAGGYTIWLQLPATAGTEGDWNGRFAAAGIKLAGGDGHFPDEPDGVYFRLSIAERNESEIREGISRLAGALKQYM